MAIIVAMSLLAAPFEPARIRQVFETWSIRVPESFQETFVHDHGYWNAWDDTRSVSLSSTVVTDGRGPVRAGRILRRLPPPEGTPVAMPAGLAGWAAEVEVEPPTRASRAVTGVIVVDGRALVATITSDDIAWATSVWLSIRHDRGTRS